MQTPLWFGILLHIFLSTLGSSYYRPLTPPPPFSPYGIVRLDGQNVPLNTTVSAWCNGVQYAQTTTIILYGGATWYYNLDVPGDDPDTPAVDGCLANETVHFRIDTSWADQTAPWQSRSRQLDLTGIRLGRLEVSKTVNWNGVTPVPGQTFQICVQGPTYPVAPNCKTVGYTGGTLVWNDMLPGDYTVTETNPGTQWQVSIGGSPATVPVGGGTAFASVTNSRKLGSLQVTKTVDWNGVTPVTGQTFQICIAGPSYATPNCRTFTYPDSLVQTWSNLIPGSYTVTEPSPGPEWIAGITGSPAVVPVDGGQATSSVSNTRKRGGLQVTKTVDWNGVTPDPTRTFEICIAGPSYPSGACQAIDFDGGTLAWSNLIPGSYAVTETDPGAQWIVAISGSPATVPTDGGGATVSVTNDAVPPPVAPVIAITQLGDDLRLSWTHLSANVSYEVWRSSTDPYFEPGDGNSVKIADVPAPTVETEAGYTDLGKWADANAYYYVVRGVNPILQVSSNSNRVGKFVRTVVPGWNLVTWPLLVANTTLDGTLGAQLYGTESPTTADRVLVWSGNTQSYGSAWFCGGPECQSWGQPYYNHWLANDYSASTLTLPPDAGFWIQNRSGGVETLVILGQVAEADRSVPVGQSWQMLGSAFPTSRPLDDANLPATGTESPVTADRVLYWDEASQTYKSAWFCGGPVCESFGQPYANHWLANDYSPTSIILEPGHGFWYQNRHTPFTWINPR